MEFALQTLLQIPRYLNGWAESLLMSDRDRYYSGEITWRLGLLNAFRADVWGNDHIFKKHWQSTPQSGSEIRTMQYLEFGEHLEAVKSFCEEVNESDDKILVVKEYEVAMKIFKSGQPDYARGACILGEPGIGKSIFVAYAVIERLRERQPVAVHVSWLESNAAYLLFHQDGVELHVNDPLPLTKCPGIWAFSDSGVSIDIPAYVLRSTPGVRVFQTTSPTLQHWEKWTNHTWVNLYIMDLWSDQEIEALAWLSGDTGNSMKELAIKWGPVPRTLLRMFETPDYIVRHQNEVDSAIRRAAAYPVKALDTILSPDHPRNVGSFSLFIVRPLKKENTIFRGVPSVYPPTPWLTCKLADRLVLQADNVKLEFFISMVSHPHTRSTAHWISEWFVHRFFVRGGTFMVRWYPEYNHAEPLTVRSLKTYHAIIDLNSKAPFYWKPDSESTSYRGIDGAVVTKDCVYVIQATITRDCESPQDGVDELWKSMPPARKHLPWKLLVVGLVEAQTWYASVGYAGTLEFGDPPNTSTGEQKTQGGTPRARLPVGLLSVLPFPVGLRYTDLVEELRRYRELEDHAEEASTEVASEMVQDGVGAMDTWGS